MTMTGTDGRQVVRAFVEHEHEELAAGIGRIHDLRRPTSRGCRSTRSRRGWPGSCAGSTRSSGPTWPGRSPGCFRRSTTGRRRRGRPPRAVRPSADPRAGRAPARPRDARRPWPAARGDHAGRRSRGPRGADARQHRARGAVPAARCWIARPIDGHPSGGTDRRPTTTSSGRRTSRSRGAVDLGLPRAPRPARRAGAGVPARGASGRADPAALRSRGDRLLGQRGRARRTTDDHARDRDAALRGRTRGASSGWSTGSAISNEYLTFGGHLDAALIDDVVVAAFASPAPLLRRGGHSQAWDAGADAIGGFFARMMVAVDYKPGFEAALRGGGPAGPIRGVHPRHRSSAAGHARAALVADDDLARIACREATRLRASAPAAWAAADALLEAGGGP